MTASAARPLRALAGVMILYAAGRTAMAGYDFVPTSHAAVTPSVGELLTRMGPAQATAAPTPISGRNTVPPAPILNGLIGSARRLGGVVTQVETTDRSREAFAFKVLPSTRPWAVGSQTLATGRVESAASLAAVEPMVQTSVPAPVPSSSPATRSAGPLSGSAWLFARDGSGGRDLAATGTLGGSQAGARLLWDVGARPAFLTARISGALAARDCEVALGVGVRGRNIGAIVEQRLAIDGSGRRETAVLGYGGFSEVPGPGDLRFDGYGQAGIVGVSRRALFVDGALRTERTLIESARSRLSAGGGLWGAAQPGASRLDVGPQLVIRTPLGSLSARVSAEYRLRIAGNARPDDGLAIGLGADF